MHPTEHERACLRRLAARVAEIAALPEQQPKREAVKALNRLDPVLPRIYCFPEGAWLECIPPETLECSDPLLRAWEMRLRMAVYMHEFLGDDQPIDAVFNVPWDIGFTGWGLDVKIETPDAEQRQTYYVHPYLSLSLQSHSHLGAVHYEAPLKARDDLERLQPQRCVINGDTSRQWLELAHDLFAGILDVRRRGNPWLLIGGFPVTAIQLRGMENLMLDMYDAPEWVQRFATFLADSHAACLDTLERGGYLTLNNGCEWIGTGGIGYSDELPAPDFRSDHVRCRDVWGGLQAQDLVGISGEMFAEFFLPPLTRIMERFGLSTFGCCEPADPWLAHLKTIRNLRRISISPWAGVRKCAEMMGGKYVFSYKPLPTPLCTNRFAEAAIQEQLIQVLGITREHRCPVEILMKDLHTIQHQPQRLRRWVQLARAAIREVYD